MKSCFIDGGWDDLRAHRADPGFARILANNVRALAALRSAPSLLDQPADLDEPEGRRADYGARVIKHRIQRATVAWRLDGAAADLAEVRLLVQALLDMDWHPLPAHAGSGVLARADLHSGDSWYIAAFALDAIGNDLGALRQNLIDRLRTSLRDDYLLGIAEGEWWRRAEFNWGSALHGNALLGGLVLREADPDLSRRVVAAAREGLGFVIDNLPVGGFWCEGPMYAATALGHLTDGVAGLYRIHGDDLGLGVNRRLHDQLDGIIDVVAPDGRLYNFSNCMDGNCEWTLSHWYWWAEHCQRPEWAGLADQYPKRWQDIHGVFSDIEALWLRRPGQASAPAKPSRLRHSQGLDWLTWRGDANWIGIRAGFGGGNHSNRDLGSFIYGIGTERICCDPGYGAGSATHHNAITIRGQEPSASAIAPIVRYRDRGASLYVCIDGTACFADNVSLWQRHIIVQDGACLCIVDEILGRQGRRVGPRYHLQTRLPVAITNGQGRLGTHRLVLPQPVCDLRSKDWDQRGQPVTTVSWRDRVDPIRALHITVIAHREGPVSAQRSGDYLHLTLPGGPVCIDLAACVDVPPEWPGVPRPA